MSLFKLAAAVAVFAAATALGRQLGLNLERRPGQLRDCLAALQVLESEIQYAASPLADAIGRAGAAAGGPVGSAFAAAAGRLGAGEAAETAWAVMLAALETDTALRAEDVAALAPLGLQLGLTGAEDQRRHLQLARSGLERQLRKADTEAARLSRLYRYAGPLAGSAAVVLLL